MNADGQWVAPTEKSLKKEKYSLLFSHLSGLQYIKSSYDDGILKNLTLSLLFLQKNFQKNFIQYISTCTSELFFCITPCTRGLSNA